MRRQPRDRRRRGVEVRLTTRDEDLLRALARFGFAETGALLPVCFAGIRPDTAKRRIRLLYDSSHLDVRVRGRDRENLYCLGPKGRQWLESRGVRPSKPPRGSLEHHLAIVRAWAVVASHGISRLTVARTLPDWEIRQRVGAAGSELVPDLFVVFRGFGRTVPLAVEADLGTESLGVLTDKVRRYEDLRQHPSGLFGARDFGLGFVLSDGRRRRHVEELLDAEWRGWSVIWSDRSDFSPAFRAALGEVAAPLTTSPYRKGSTSDLSSSPTADTKEADTGL